MTQTSKVGYLYINGLSDGRAGTKDKLVKWWWQRAGRNIEHAHINWYDGRSLAEKEQQVKDHINGMLELYRGIAIIGGSAGGSLAFNVFSHMKAQNICAVAAHARMQVGNYPQSSWMSLYRRAKLDTNHPSQAFYDSVVKVDASTIPGFGPKDKERLLTLTQLTDMVVDLKLMAINGVKCHRSWCFGHSGGFLAHLFADRDLTIQFAESKLL